MTKIEKVPYPIEIGYGDVAFLVEHQRRPWVQLNSLCAALGVPYAGQTRRLQRHARANGLEIAQYSTEKWHVVTLLPLEELAWWLRTLRPSDPKARRKLSRWRKVMPWRLIHSWVEIKGQYAPARTLQKRLRGVEAARKMPPRRSGSKFTTDDIQAARILIGKGYTQSQAARHIGVSPATLSLVLRGKYPSQVAQGDGKAQDIADRIDEKPMPNPN